MTGTRADAEAALADLRAQAATPQRGLLSAAVTLNDLIARYFERGSRLSPGTRRTYESLWRCWIQNGIGQRRASGVDAYDFIELWRHMTSAGLTKSTMNSAFALIKGTYRAAAKFDEFDYNTARFVAPARPDPFVREHPEDDTLRSILAAAAEAEEYWPLFIRLALATGARRGELAALRWNALDGDLLSIRNSVDFDKRQMVLSRTKNDQPRTIALDDESARRWRVALAEANLAYLGNFNESMPLDTFVFAGQPIGLRPVRPDALSKQWRTICEAARVEGVELREMRNWHATTLDIDFEYPVESIGRRLGHSQGRSATRITQRYITTVRERDRRMAANIATRIAEIESRPMAVSVTTAVSDTALKPRETFAAHH